MDSVEIMTTEYGIWNTHRKEFQFGIREPSRTKAWNKLKQKICSDWRKWRFEVREIKSGDKFQERVIYR